MREIRVQDIINICDGNLLCGNENDILENFKKDTREIKEGDTYIGIKGENFNRKRLLQSSF